MRKTIPKSAFKVRAETPQVARGYGGSCTPQSLPQTTEPKSQVQRKEGDPLRNAEVLYGRNNLPLRRER